MCISEDILQKYKEGHCASFWSRWMLHMGVYLKRNKLGCICYWM